MNTVRLQRGQLLVAGIVLIVVIALMIGTLGYLYVSGESAGTLHGQSERAYFAAQSGIEYSSGQYFNGTGCSALNNANVPVGGAAVTFSLTPTLYAPPTLTLTATTAALTAASATVPVTSTAGYAPYGRILIDSELINYTSKTATNFNGLKRGVGGTTAAAHASPATVSQNLCVITSTGTAGNAKRIVEGALGAGTTASPGALGTMGADAIVVYAKGTAVTGAGSDRNIYYRLWNGSTSNWGAEQTSTQQVSANSSPVFFTVQLARTRNEAIMGVLDGNRNLYLHVWNGIAWSNPRGAGVTLSTPSTNLTRNVQIAYEYTSDKALIIYQNNTSDPQYATWNGAALTLAGNVVAAGYPVSGSNGPQCGPNLATNTIPVQLWFRLAPRNVAGSNDILMMSDDCKQDVYGMRWTGAAWDDFGITTRWDTSISSTNNREAVDVAWQSDGNTAVFFYGDAANLAIRSRTWTASTSTLSALTASTTFAFPGLTVTTGNPAARFEWLRLYPGPSNVILAILQTGQQTTGPALVSTIWSGGAFGNDVTHDNGTVENQVSRSFDFVWEKLPSASGKGWLLWGSQLGGSTGIRTRYFTSPAAWGAASTIRDRSLLLQAGALSPSGRFVAGTYQSTPSATDDIESVTTTGGGTVWPNVGTTLWAGATTVQQGERVFVVTREGNRINTGGTGVVSILQTQEILP